MPRRGHGLNFLATCGYLPMHTFYSTGVCHIERAALRDLPLATKSRVPVMSVMAVKHRAEAVIYLLGNEERSLTELLAKAERRCH